MIVPAPGPASAAEPSPPSIPECVRLLMRATRPLVVVGDLVAVRRPHHDTAEETVEAAIVLGVSTWAHYVDVIVEFADGHQIGLETHHLCRSPSKHARRLARPSSGCGGRSRSAAPWTRGPRSTSPPSSTRRSASWPRTGGTRGNEGYRHPKTLDLATMLKIQRLYAVGLLEGLWDFAGDQSPQGNIGKWSNAVIAAACDWPGDPDEFVEALVDSRHLDRCTQHRLVIHDLADHAL